MKKIICLVSVICLSLCLCSCFQDNNSQREIIDQVVDGAGRTINIYDDREKTTVASVYFVSVPFFVALKMTDRVLAVNTRNTFWKEADDNLKKAGTVGKGNVDLEKLAYYNPTVLVHRSNDLKTIDAVSKLGIDTICIKVENAQDIIDTLLILGKYFGVEDNADKAISWFNSKISKIDEVVNNIPLNERKTALLMGGDLGRVSGKDMLQSWMIEKAGGMSVVEEFENNNWVNIGIERIFEYDPDYLFCTSSSARSYTIDDIYSNEAWSDLKAVKSENIYDVPTKYDSWDMPGISCELGIFFMIHKMYPAYYSVEDLEDEVDDYYRFMFGRCFDEELELDWDNFE